MVNTGKPSTGCKLCRIRRVKCDETKPSCLKCLKYGRSCPGYRNPYEVKIRDETQTTIRRLQKKPKTKGKSDSHETVITQIHHPKLAQEDPYPATQGAASQASGPPTYYSPIRPHPHGRSTQDNKNEDDPDDMEFLLPHLAYPVDEQATCFFLSDFVMLPNGLGSRGYYNFVLSLLRKGNLSKGFTSSFKAVAMAALSSRPGSQTLLTNAEVWYTRACREVYRSIDDGTAKEDQTLAAVLLLSFYEVLSPCGQLTQYINHMRGAAALARLRGPPQLGASREAVEMYALTRNQLLTLYTMPIETNLDGADYAFLATTILGTPAWPDRVAGLNIACTKLRAATDQLLRRWPKPPSSSRTGIRGEGSDGDGNAELQYARGLLDKGVVLLHEVDRFVETAPEEWAPDVFSVLRWREQWRRSMDDGASEAFSFHDDYEGWGGPGVEDGEEGKVYQFPRLHSAILLVITWTSNILATTSVTRLAAAIGRAEYAQRISLEKGKGGVGEGKEYQSSDTTLPSPPPSSIDDSQEMNTQYPTQDGPPDYKSHPAYPLAATIARKRIADLIATIPFFCTWNGAFAKTNNMNAPIDKNQQQQPHQQQQQHSPPDSTTSSSEMEIKQEPQHNIIPSGIIVPDVSFPCGDNQAYLDMLPKPLSTSASSPYYPSPPSTASISPPFASTLSSNVTTPPASYPDMTTLANEAYNDHYHNDTTTSSTHNPQTNHQEKPPQHTHRAPPAGPRGSAPVKGLSGIMIVWPIFATAASSFASPAQQAYLRRRLEWLRDVVGIRQAGVLVRSMEDVQSPDTEVRRDMGRMGWECGV